MRQMVGSGKLVFTVVIHMAWNYGVCLAAHSQDPVKCSGMRRYLEVCFFSPPNAMMFALSKYCTQLCSIFQNHLFSNEQINNFGFITRFI